MPPGPQDGGVTHAEFRTAFNMIAQIIANQVNQGANILNAPTSTSRVSDFARMNSPEIHGSKVEEDAQDFVD